MRDEHLQSNAKLFEHITRHIDYYSKIIGSKRSAKKQWFRYNDISNGYEEVQFDPNRITNIELSFKINNQWERWVKVKQSTIFGADNGLFSSRYFKKGDSATVFMGKRLSNKEMNNNLHSNYALDDIEPCNLRNELHHYYFLAQMINHGNYTVANIRFEKDFNGYCIKDVGIDEEFFLDYQRPIYCKKCWDELKYRRVVAKTSVEGAKGKCSMCKSREEKLILRECPICQKKLCSDCYDKLQVK